MDRKISLKIISGVLLCTMFTYTVPVLAYTKEETVYSKLDATGNRYNTIVSNHIKNKDKEKIINDLSDLFNIENINSDNEPTKDGNKLVWDANECDVYYQGESQKDLPIECNVKYELDGNEISANEIVGRSGKVKIKLEYKNKDKHIVNVNGVNETLYTPFVIVCGTIINNESNKNITIKNGKAIDDGTKTIAIGMVVPGLQTSLGISKSQIDIPDTVEIAMDTTDFELNNIVTYVTPKILENSDLSLFNKLDGIYSKVSILQSSSKQLVTGANTLNEGVNNGLQIGAKAISDGTVAVSSNLKIISEKIGDVQTGIDSLQVGEQQISSGLDTMIVGVSAITTDNSDKINDLNALINGNNTAKTNLTTAIQTMETTKNTLISNKTALNNQLSTLQDGDPQITAINQQIAMIDTQIASIDMQITQFTELIGLLELNNQANRATLATLSTMDANSVNGLLGGLNQLKAGMTELQAGTSALTSGTGELKQGATILTTKSQELSVGAKSLYQGTETISQGVKSLAEGITKFDAEGIEPICNYINGDLKSVTVRIEKLQKLAEQYNNFTMLNDGAEGSVKFIMIMDGVKKNNINVGNSKPEIILNTSEEKKKGE